MSSIATPTSPPSSHNDEKPLDETKERKKNIWAGKSGRFWAAFATLNLTAFISALDAVIIAAALPAITSELGGSSSGFLERNSIPLGRYYYTTSFRHVFGNIWTSFKPCCIDSLVFTWQHIVCLIYVYGNVYRLSGGALSSLIFLILDSRNWRWRNDCIG